MPGRQSSEVKQALKAYQSGATDIYKLAKKFGLSPSTIYRAIKRLKK